jgi:class 3 adenylate cyclase
MAGETPDPRALERKLATILSADVAEYGRLMAESEEETLQTFRGHRRVFESLVTTYRGRIFNTAGDAILAEFGSAVEAVRCATDIQSALRTRNDQLAPSRQVKFRIGLNLGDVMVQGSDLLGDGVNVAARIQSAATPGGVCLSGSVYDQIRNKLSLSFRSLGEQRYKNIPQPVRTYSITDSDDFGTLPAASSRKTSKRWIILAATAVCLLLIAGYWPLKTYRDQKALESLDGFYGGQVCIGPYREEPARCYTARGIVVKAGRLSAKYPAKDPGDSNVITGAVSQSGDVMMELHIENSNGVRLVGAHISGKLANGVLTANGDGFRTYNIYWRRE